MAEELQSLLQHMRRQGELWHFQMAEWKCGVVYADGCKDTQFLPRAATANSRGEQLRWQQWWPVIFVQMDATRVVAFCQDQALTLSRPWLTYIDRVVCCRGASQQLLDARGRTHVVPAQLSAPPAKHPADLAAVSTAYDPVHSTTVVIEEVEETAGASEWKVVSHSELEEV